MVGCNRFSYQQAIHSLRHCKHLEVLDFGAERHKASIVLGQAYSKSVYPVWQVHLWLGPRLASHPIVEVYWTQLSSLKALLCVFNLNADEWAVLQGLIKAATCLSRRTAFMFFLFPSHVVGIVTCLVRLCPNAHQAWVDVSTISRPWFPVNKVLQTS